MLPYSQKPQILRMHSLQQKERNKFTSQCEHALLEMVPPSVARSLQNSSLLRQLMQAVPDLYFTLVTYYVCRRRLGEEYTYIAMYKPQHYEQQGVLLNKKTRLLFGLLEVISRNLVCPLFFRIMKSGFAVFDENQSGGLGRLKNLLQKLKEQFLELFGSAQDIMSYAQWIVLMVYLLGWNKHLTILETILGINYAYTYKNDQIHDASYAMEGYILLATFIYKVVKQLITLVQRYKHRKNQLTRQNTIGVPLEKSKITKKSQQTNFKKINKVDTVGGLRPRTSEEVAPKLRKESKHKETCRICYGDMENRSATSCGHVFCWSCITKTLEISPECPVCRSPCLPREVIQLRNF